MLSEKELAELRREIDAELQRVEGCIWDLESLYLEETQHQGSLVFP